MEGRRLPKLAHLLAGFEAGVLGSLTMLAWLMLGSLWLRRSAWTIPNLFATVLAGPEVYGNRYLRTSLAGAALVIVIYGALGVLWGAACGFGKADRRSSVVSIIGAAFGLAVYFVFFRFVWPHTRPLLPLYAPDRQFEAAHILWGMVLARSPGFARGIAARAAGSPWRYSGEAPVGTAGARL